jgi:DNA-directed RNA polymerase subunit RPC12/RpoP
MKEHIEIRCRNCGSKLSIGWPTPHVRHARIKCAACGVDFPLAEAVERSIIGIPDERDPHLVREAER